MFQGDDFEVHRRKKRQVTDANGNRVLRVVKRDATEMAEVETTERIIQVKNKNKIPFQSKRLCNTYNTVLELKAQSGARDKACLLLS